MDSIPVMGVTTPDSDAAASTSTDVFPFPDAARDPTAAADKELDPLLVDRLPVYQKLLCYAREFLAKPHPEVGRRGPVCPFVPVSLKRDALHLAVIQTDDLLAGAPDTPEGRAAALVPKLTAFMRGMVDVYKGLEPSSGRYAAYKALVLVFPDIPQAEAPDIVDVVQDQCKPEFVRLGYMLGEFHRFNNTPGLRNDQFFPLRTPYPVSQWMRCCGLMRCVCFTLFYRCASRRRLPSVTWCRRTLLFCW